MIWNKEPDGKLKRAAEMWNTHVLYPHLYHHKVQAFNMMMIYLISGANRYIGRLDEVTDTLVSPSFLAICTPEKKQHFLRKLKE